VRDHCRQPCRVDAGRKPNREDRVIESHVGRRSRRHRAALGVDEHVVRVDTYLLQHRGEQGHFVLAIAVAVRQDFARRVRLHAADAQLDGYIANVPLSEDGERSHLAQHIWRGRRELLHLLTKLRRGIAPAVRQAEIPRADFLPALKPAAFPVGWLQ
jgi:hypothetical protein